MKLTKKGITLLTKQYKSVLKKCFLINMGLFALGAVSAISAEIADAATTLSPTLDAYQLEAKKNVIDKAKTYFGFDSPYVLTAGSSTAATDTNISYNGQIYHYTTPTNLDSVKAAMLRYLSDSTAVAMTNEDVSDDNAVFSISGTNYTFATGNLPTSAYALTKDGVTQSNYDIKYNDTLYKFDLKTNEGDIATYSAGSSGNYDFQVLKATSGGMIRADKYYNIAINPNKTSHNNGKIAWVSSPTEPSATWFDYAAGSSVSFSGNNVTGAIRLKTPHNGTVGDLNTWNKWFTYTYKKGTYEFVKEKTSNVATTSAGSSSAYKVPTDGRDDNVITNAEGITIPTGNDAITDKTYASNRLEGSFYNEYNIIGGSAILNQGTIGDVIADFVGNRTNANGGRINFTMGAVANIAIESGKTASINSITGDFVGNSLSSSSYYTTYSNLATYSYGGAISNFANSGTATIGSIEGDFIGNSIYSSAYTNGSSTYGGAISNYTDSGTVTIDSIKGDFIGNSTLSYNNSSAFDSYGGAISNIAKSGTATISFIEGDFVGNSALHGGAIYNKATSGAIGSIVGNFIGNSASGPSGGAGGAISTRGTIGSIVGNFIGNSASSSSSTESYGGAIYSFGSIGSIVGDFIGNSAYSSGYGGYGGAIYNIRGKIGSIVGDFIGNSASGHSGNYGGAIYNTCNTNYQTAEIGHIKGDFISNSASSAQGGAIYNSALSGTAKIGSIEGDFINNSGSGSSSRGGAIYNYSQSDGAIASIDSIQGDFIGNSASGTSNYSFVYGGAIVNTRYYSSGTGTATIGNIVGKFIGNYAKTTSTSKAAYGGAIFNGKIETTATYMPNAKITLGDSSFTGNYVQKSSTITPNSIYNTGVIDIANNATVKVYDGIDGYTGQINAKAGSTLELYAPMTNNTLTLDNATVVLGANTQIINSTNYSRVGSISTLQTTANGGNVSTLNNEIDNNIYSLGAVTLNGALNYTFDVSLSGTPNSDKITVQSLTNTPSIIIRAINLITGTGSDKIEVKLTDNETLMVAYTLSDDILSHITKKDSSVTYKVNSVTYDNTTGILTFNKVVDALLAANATSGTRSFGDTELATVSSVYKPTADLTGTAAGDFTINGTKSGTGSTAERATIDLNSHKGFDLANDTTLNINNTKVTNGADGVAITVSNANAKVNLNGAYIDGKITSTAAYDLTTAGETVLNGDVTAGTLTASGTLTNNGALNVGGGSNAGTIDGTGSLTNNGEFENKSGATISQDVTHNGIGTNVFTNNGTISGAVDNDGTFTNNSAISGSVDNSGTFTNTGTISGAVTNTGTMTSAAEKMTGSVANNAGGTLNLSGTLAKEITGTGTTNVDSALALNSGAGIAGTLAMDTSDTVTVSSGAITEHTIGEIKGTGNVALDINYGDTITADAITVATDTQAATLKITALNETGARAANFEKRILFGTNGNTKLDVSGLSGWNGSTDKEAEVVLKSGTIAYNDNYGTHKWTETTALTVIGSAEGLYDTLKYTTTISNDRFDPKAENLTVINQYSGTGSDDRKIDFTGIQTSASAGTYTMQASTSLGETKAGKMTLDGEKNTTTGALTVVDLNGNAGYNLTNATELVLDKVKLTGASGNNVITASDDSAKVTLNDAFVDGNIVKSSGDKMTITTSGNTTLNGNTSNVSVFNNSSSTLTNNGTITGDVTNNGTLNSSVADITGTITNNATFNMSGDLTKNIAGSGTTVLQSDTSAVAANRTVSGTLNANGKTIGMKDDAFETLTVGNLSGNGNITINAKAATQESDKINITSGTSNSSALTISSLNLDTTGLTEGDDYTKTMSVVSGNKSGVSVAFANEDVAKDYNKIGVDISKLLGTDSVDDKDVGWNETFGKWEQARKKNTSLTISGTDMVYTVTNYTVGDKVYTSNSEGLKELNAFDAGTETKTFNAASTGTTHTVIEDLGNTVGKLTINGVADAETISTIDFGGTHKAFEKIDTGAEVNLNNVKLTNANGDIANVVGGKLTATNSEIDGTLTSAGTVSLTNSSVSGNVTNSGALTATGSELTSLTNTATATLTNSSVSGNVTNSGTLNLSNSTIDGTITGSGDATLNVNSDWDMDTTVTGHTVNVNGVKLTVNADNLDHSDSLTAKDGSEIDVSNNKVTLDQVTFKSGSKLSLKVNSLSDFGAINANNISIDESGAQLSATLGQGIVKIGQKETLQLLKANNSNFNKFADSFDNEMYHFEKADNNGLYNISQVKTAEEVIEDVGGTSSIAEAAAAWVDGDEFAEGSTAKKVADTLADLAQNDPQEFNNTLSVVAPQEAPVVETAVTDVSDKLLLTVENHLTNHDIGGLSSGDMLQDVSIWAKGYYGKSKLSDSGNIKGFDSKNRGVIAGVDKKLNNAVKLGFGFQYNDSDIDAFRRDVEVDTVTGFIYGEYRPSNWYVNGIASYGRSDYKEKKYALGFKIDDKYNADTYSLQAITGYDFKYVSPEIGARYYHIKRYGYNDSIGQKVSGSNMDLLRGVIGLRSSHEFGMFKPEVYVGMTYDIVNEKDTAIVSLPNGSSYAVDGKRLNKFGTEVNTSLTANLTDHASVTVGYEGKFRKDYKDNTGLIIAKYKF